eukprot:TRINITY_DN1659_c0_g1_i5.p5 TRINITY_DN1659_c0_g1~~TRINITY_DN1659_c0_g1_i5.p5  ORF type:complete len:102 (-),score=4.88 TRINITY_DN1659_c0_g1_i5:558-863(-)
MFFALEVAIRLNQLPQRVHVTEWRRKEARRRCCISARIDITVAPLRQRAHHALGVPFPRRNVQFRRVLPHIPGGNQSRGSPLTRRPALHERFDQLFCDVRW